LMQKSPGERGDELGRIGRVWAGMWFSEPETKREI
jgi:hypothetical protein